MSVQDKDRIPAFETTANGLPRVVSVASDVTHRFSKPVREFVRLIAGYGIEGDAHAGAMVQHRYLAKRNASLPNLRQVHLIQAELFDALGLEGYAVHAGALGENITTRGVDLLALPLGTQLRLGATAIIELTGLRVPCSYIDKFKLGLKRKMIIRGADGPPYRAGVMAVVIASGEVKPGDPVNVTFQQARGSRYPRCHNYSTDNA